MEKLPEGEDLKRALAERGISTAGLPVSVLGTPMEAAMQGRLPEVVRLEREEKMAKKAAETPANLPVQKAYPLLKTQLDKLQALKGRNYQESDAAEDEWIQLTEKLVLRSFGSGSTNYGNILHARAAGEHYMQLSRPGTPPPHVQNQRNFEARQRAYESVLRSCIAELEIDLPQDRATPPHGDRVFIGHGADPTWREVKDFVVDRLKLAYDEFNREPTAGMTTAERLQKMLDESAFALIIMTAEDEHDDGKQHARENVVHEAGLFQGRLGFRRAIILLEEGCEEFSNIEGVTQIRFTKGKIGSVSLLVEKL
jgi:predicted nucleotide-binding protein